MGANTPGTSSASKTKKKKVSHKEKWEPGRSKRSLLAWLRGQAIATVVGTKPYSGKAARK